MIAITPTEFQSQALAWISAISLVTVAVVAAVGKVMGEMKVLRTQSQSHADDIRSINEQITSVAASVPPAAPVAASTPVSGQPADDTPDRP